MFKAQGVSEEQFFLGFLTLGNEGNIIQNVMNHVTSDASHPRRWESPNIVIYVLNSVSKINILYLPECKMTHQINYLCITNKMQHYTIFFITINALHVSGGFSAHHQELKNCTHTSIGNMSSLRAATASVGELELVCVRCWMCTVFELLMMGGETA